MCILFDQCVYPDAYLGPGNGKALTEAAKDFTWINVQFYNNYFHQMVSI